MKSRSGKTGKDDMQTIPTWVEGLEALLELQLPHAAASSEEEGTLIEKGGGLLNRGRGLDHRPLNREIQRGSERGSVLKPSCTSVKIERSENGCARSPAGELAEVDEQTPNTRQQYAPNTDQSLVSAAMTCFSSAIGKQKPDIHEQYALSFTCIQTQTDDEGATEEGLVSAAMTCFSSAISITCSQAQTHGQDATEEGLISAASTCLNSSKMPTDGNGGRKSTEAGYPRDEQATCQRRYRLLQALQRRRMLVTACQIVCDWCRFASLTSQLRIAADLQCRLLCQ